MSGFREGIFAIILGLMMLKFPNLFSGFAASSEMIKCKKYFIIGIGIVSIIIGIILLL